MKDNAYNYFLKKLQAKPDANERVIAPYSLNESIRNIHFVGICGKAMASLAGLFVKAGYVVTGSDDAWNPPMSTMLEQLGITGAVFNPENLVGVDLVIMGNAFGPSNIEAKAARERNVPQLSSAEAYAQFFIKNARSIVVAGTHGKTTISSLATHVFMNSSFPTNALVGGVLRNSGQSYHFGAPEALYSVVEGDEYDTAYFDKAPKFLHYRPTIGIITSIEFDHADIYSDMDDYLAAFVFFAGEIPFNGYLLVSESVKDEYVSKLREACLGKVYLYGSHSSSDIYSSDVRIDASQGGQYFTMNCNGVTYKDLFIPLFGAYNVENALAVAAIAIIEGVEEQSLKESFVSFLGAEERQQTLYDKRGIIVMNDFAHHPTAVALTLGGVRDHYPDKRIIGVFEPRSATSRRKDFEERYMESFDSVDIAVISTPPIKATDDSANMMDVKKVVKGIQERGVQAHDYFDADGIFEYLKHTVVINDVVVIMSNGHFDGLPERLVEFLESKV